MGFLELTGVGPGHGVEGVATAQDAQPTQAARAARRDQSSEMKLRNIETRETPTAGEWDGLEALEHAGS